MREIARRRPRFGYRRLTLELRKSGLRVNPKRVQRWFREPGLQVRPRLWKRPWRAVAAPPRGQANQEWAMDFVSNATASGQMLRILAVLDVGTRECLALEGTMSWGATAWRGRWSGLARIAVFRRPSEWTMGRTLPAGILWLGLQPGGSRWSTFSSASRCRTR
jgi:putative transposase